MKLCDISEIPKKTYDRTKYIDFVIPESKLVPIEWVS